LDRNIRDRDRPDPGYGNREVAAMNQPEIIFDDFLNLNISCFLPIIVVYKQPKDYPDKFVARIWDVNMPTQYVVLKDSLEEIHAAIPQNMHLFPPSKNDDPVIVETYL
jgi:hypothetical protein